MSGSQRFHRFHLRVTWLLLTMLPGLAQAGAMSVTVLDAVSSRPLVNVEVTAESRVGEVRRATTGPDGSASFEDLSDGFHEFRVEAEGYVPSVESGRIIERRTAQLRFELQPRPPTLEEVVVVARAREADPFGSAADRRLSREELRNSAGSGSDAMRALVGLPGVVANGEFASFSVRGHGPKNNLIFVDGFPFQQVVHFEQTLGEQQDIVNGGRYSIFAPNAVTGAEFSPGGWSAEFGGRKASLLQFEVADGSSSPVGSLRADLAGFEVLYEGPSGFHDDTSMFLQARRFDFGQFFELIGEDDLGSPVSSDVILKTRTRLQGDDEIEFLAIYAPEDYERDIDNVLAAKDEGEGIEDLSLQDNQQDLSLFGATWRRLFGDDGEWTNRVYVRQSDKTSAEGEAYPDLVPDGTPSSQVPARARLLTVKEKDSESGWRSDVTMGNGLGRLAAGLHVASVDLDYSTALREDWIRFVYESDDPRPPGEDYIVLRPAEINSRYRQSQTNYALYGEQVFDWGDILLRGGVRYDHDGFSDENLFSPRLALNYVLSPVLRLSATTGVFYDSPRNLIRASDPDNFGLENEELIHFGTGLDFRINRNLSLLVDAYYQQLDNLLVEGSQTSLEVSNDGDGHNLGADFVLTRSFAEGWAADLVYSWNRYRVDDNDGRGDYNWDFNRTHFFSLGGRWEINNRWQVAARFKYGSGQPGDRFISHSDVLAPSPPVRFSKEITETNVGRGDAFHGLDLRVDYRRPIGPVDLVLFLDVLNVYGGPSGLPAEFNILTGDVIEEEEETLPLLGLIFEYAW